MEIKRSVPENSFELTDICRKSKNSWNYPAEWMKLWEADLQVSQNFIHHNNVCHIENDEQILGFYSFLPDGNNIRLEHLFIRPDHINKGLGKILMTDFFEKIENINFKNITLDADQNAEGFYKKFGFERSDLKSTKIEGRYLPVMIKPK